jgi:uncharacterized membrane protein
VLPLAAAKTVWDLLDQSMWSGIGLVVALLWLAWAAYRLRSWYGEDEDRADAGQEMLSQLRQMRAEGEVSEEEFRSIKGRLAQSRERPAGPPTE